MGTNPYLVAVAVCIPKGTKLALVQQEMVLDYGLAMEDRYWFSWESGTRILTMHAGDANADAA